MKVCQSVMEDPVKHQDPFRHTALEQNTLGCADEDSKVIFFLSHQVTEG